MAKKNQAYDGSSIQVLSDIEHVRLRLPLYLGNKNETTFIAPIFDEKTFEVGEVTFIPALMKAISEVIDNAVDELVQVASKNKVITIDVDELAQRVTISDNGRGIPIDKHATGRYTPEVALASLRAGRNFEDDRETGVIGQNGVGASVTNVCSEWFRVTIHRDGKVYKQTFTDGTTQISKPSIKAGGTKTGTMIEFILDSKVFGHQELPVQAIKNRAYEVALTNPNFTVIYNGEKIRYKGGLPELAGEVSEHQFVFQTAYDDGTELQFIVIPDFHDNADEQMFTWVNSSLVYDGGLTNTQFMNAFTDHVIAHLESAAKKDKVEVTKADVKRGLLILASLKLKSPEYDSQAKTRLTGPNMRKQINDTLDDQWKSFARKNKDWIATVFENASDRYRKKADKDAVKKHVHTKRVEGLLDATSSDRKNCYLFVTEGDSAKETITQARNPKVHATFPLTGKINDVWGSTIAQVLKMEKIAGLLQAVGLTPGVKADPDSMRFGYIVLSCDADTDGAHITTLLVSLLFKFWPELFDKKHPRVYRLMTPNVVAIKGSERIHFHTQAQFAAVSDKYKGWKIKYNKGLGSLQFEDWRMVLEDVDKSCHVIVDDGKLTDVLKLHFSDDVGARKNWLMGLT